MMPREIRSFLASRLFKQWAFVIFLSTSIALPILFKFFHSAPSIVIAILIFFDTLVFLALRARTSKISNM